MTINLKMPDIRELKPRITVFGVGGAGGNAVNNMITAGLVGCDFVVANTDAQALGHLHAHLDDPLRLRHGERLGVGVGHDKIATQKPGGDHVVDGIPPCTANPEYGDPRL